MQEQGGQGEEAKELSHFVMLRQGGERQAIKSYYYEKWPTIIFLKGISFLWYSQAFQLGGRKHGHMASYSESFFCVSHSEMGPILNYLTFFDHYQIAGKKQQKSCDAQVGHGLWHCFTMNQKGKWHARIFTFNLGGCHQEGQSYLTESSQDYYSQCQSELHVLLRIETYISLVQFFQNYLFSALILMNLTVP